MNQRLIAIGDIHGCLYTLKALLKKVDYDYKKDRLVFIGDYIDRGEHAYETVRYLMDLQKTVGEERCVCLMGNHEDMAIRSNGTYDDLWIGNGGYNTIIDFEQHPDMISTILNWFESLPLVCEAEGFIFCHAGLTHPMLDNNDSDMLLWGRKWIKSDSRPREKRVIFGHTPEFTGAYVTKSGDLCIDSGCVYGGALCAVVIQNGEIQKFVYQSKHQEDLGDE